MHECLYCLSLVFVQQGIFIERRKAPLLRPQRGEGSSEGGAAAEADALSHCPNLS